MRCPVIVLVSDLERFQGFTDLIERMPSGQAGKRMGQRFPLLPDLDNGAVPGSIESSVSWISNTLFPSLVYSLFKVETPGGEDATDVLQANSQLYRFLSRIRERQETTARLVKESIPAVPDEPILFGGCYFAGTGVSTGNGQAFASGVLRRLIDDQDSVTWTSNAMKEDTSMVRLASGLKVVFLAVIGLGILLILAVIGWRFWPRAEQPAADDETQRYPGPCRPSSRDRDRDKRLANGRLPARCKGRRRPYRQTHMIRGSVAQGTIRSRSCVTICPDGTVTSFESRRRVACLKQRT